MIRLDMAEFLGIPWRLNGRDRTGADCLGLVVMYLHAQGVRVPDGDGLPVTENWREDSPGRALSWLSHHATRVDSPAPNDIVLFRIPSGGGIHLGVMVDTQRILHVLEDRPSMLTPLRQMRQWIMGIYRLAPP